MALERVRQRKGGSFSFPKEEFERFRGQTVLPSYLKMSCNLGDVSCRDLKLEFNQNDKKYIKKSLFVKQALSK